MVSLRVAPEGRGPGPKVLLLVGLIGIAALSVGCLEGLQQSLLGDGDSVPFLRDAFENVSDDECCEDRHLARLVARDGDDLLILEPRGDRGYEVAGRQTVSGLEDVSTLDGRIVVSHGNVSLLNLSGVRTTSTVLENAGPLETEDGTIFTVSGPERHRVTILGGNLTVLEEFDIPRPQDMRGDRWDAKPVHAIDADQESVFLLDNVYRPLYAFRLSVESPSDLNLTHSLDLSTIQGHLSLQWYDNRTGHWHILREKGGRWGDAQEVLSVGPAGVVEENTTLYRRERNFEDGVASYEVTGYEVRSSPRLPSNWSLGVREGMPFLVQFRPDGDEDPFGEAYRIGGNRPTIASDGAYLYLVYDDQLLVVDPTAQKILIQDDLPGGPRNLTSLSAGDAPAGT